MPKLFWRYAHWSRFSQEGVSGDASAATVEFGARLFELTVTRFVELVREFCTIPIRPRVDHHAVSPLLETA